MSQFFSIVPYPSAKVLILGGARGYFIQRNGYITIMLVENAVESEFPGAAAFDELPPEFRMTFSRDWEEDFHKTVASLLLRSELSDPPAR